MARKYSDQGPMKLNPSSNEGLPSGTKKIMLGDVPCKDLWLGKDVGTLSGVDKQIKNTLKAINKTDKGN